MNNRGLYILIIENDEFQQRNFLNESSELYTFLKNHFLTLEYKFEVSCNPFSDNEIPIEGVQFLLDRIRNDIKILIELYENKPINKGLNAIELDYKGKKLKLYCNASTLHLMIYHLVQLIDQLESVIEKNKTVFICGNANFTTSMLQSLLTLRDDFKVNGKINSNLINKVVLDELIKNKCLMASENEYKITRKGFLLAIAE